MNWPESLGAIMKVPLPDWDMSLRVSRYMYSLVSSASSISGFSAAIASIASRVALATIIFDLATPSAPIISDTAEALASTRIWVLLNSAAIASCSAASLLSIALTNLAGRAIRLRSTPSIMTEPSRDD